MPWLLYVAPLKMPYKNKGKLVTDFYSNKQEENVCVTQRHSIGTTLLLVGAPAGGCGRRSSHYAHLLRLHPPPPLKRLNANVMLRYVYTA